MRGVTNATGRDPELAVVAITAATARPPSMPSKHATELDLKMFVFYLGAPCSCWRCYAKVQIIIKKRLWDTVHQL